MKKMLGLYIHVPFCAKVCDYCDFRVMPALPRLYQEYADLLCQEVETFALRHLGLLQAVETLYLGGGTPSILPFECLAQIFDCLKDVGVPLKTLKEISMEFNPESTNDDTVDFALGLGIGRFSLGIQTFDENLLKRIGRSHTEKAALNALEILTLRKVRASGDLMFNLPGQSLESFLNDVDRLSDFNLSHVSFYGLTVSPRSRLGHRIAKGDLKIDEDLYEKMYLRGVELLDSKGVKRYEVSNFSRPGFESLHNKNYWNRGEYVGFGPGAHSYLGNTRFYAPEIYPRWREFVKNRSPESMVVADKLNEEDILMEHFWLSLRQSAGLDLKGIQAFGIKLEERSYERWLKRDFVQIEDGFLRLKGRGWVFMDDIVTDLANGYSKL